MKTDSTVEKTIQTERRRLFWRLYSLPWIITVICLLLIVLGSLLFIKDSQKTSIEQQESARAMGMYEGKQNIRIEAIDQGYGKWIVDREGLVKFNWSDKIDNKEFDLPPKGMEREYSFTHEDYKLSKDIGLDLELMLIKSCQEVIDTVVEHSRNMTQNQFEKQLKVEIEKIIRRSFDGFETYKRVR